MPLGKNKFPSPSCHSLHIEVGGGLASILSGPENYHQSSNINACVCTLIALYRNQTSAPLFPIKSRFFPLVSLHPMEKWARANQQRKHPFQSSSWLGFDSCSPVLNNWWIIHGCSSYPTVKEFNGQRSTTWRFVTILYVKPLLRDGGVKSVYRFESCHSLARFCP